MASASPISASRYSTGSRPAASASSFAKQFIAKACWMLLTERYQPTRIMTSASPFSMRRFGTSL